jgi:ferritin
MNTKLENAINEQMNFEIYSSYLYMAISSYFKNENLNGFANWMAIQAQEELTHTMKFYNYLHEREGKVIFEAIAKPPVSWESPLKAFEAAYEHEKIVTSRISDLMDLAIQVKDHATHTALQWYITEQVEEEASVLNIIRQLRLIKNAPNGMFMLDRELAQRTFMQTTNN